MLFYRIRPLLFLLFIPLSQINADNDSLWSIWNNPQLADTIRIDAMSELAWDGYLLRKPDSAFICAQLAYDLAKTNGLKGKMATALNTQGASFWARGIYSKALLYFEQSYELFNELGDLINSASCLNNIGIIYRSQGNNLKGLRYLLESLGIREELKDSSGLPSILSNIGLIYQDQKNYEKAMDYYLRSLQIRELVGGEDKMAGTLTNIGLIHQIQKKYDKALVNFERALAINQRIGDKKGEANTLNNIGLLYKEEGEIDSALIFLERSKVISVEIGDNNGMANSLMSIGMIKIAQAKYIQAIQNCEDAYDLSEGLGDALMQKESCTCLFHAYKGKGDAVNALAYHERLVDIEDSLHKIEISKNLQEMEFEREVARDSITKVEEVRAVQEAHEEEMHKEEKTRNVFAGVGLLFLILAGAFFSRWRFVKRSNAVIRQEKERSEKLLLNILPSEIAQELKDKGKAEARDFEMVSILFTDFKSFTEQSEKLSASELVNEINHCFEAFDGIIEKYGIEKIKTIGDAYMAAGGLPVPTDDSVKNTVLAALEMQEFIINRKATIEAQALSPSGGGQGEVKRPTFEMRVGIHTGPVVAGIVGVKKFQYDIWGDTVNTASRMESAGEVGKVNISQATYELLKDASTGSASAFEFVFESRGKIEAKGKGEMEMYFVSVKA